MRIEVDWDNERDRKRWHEAWEKARASGRVNDGYECAAYGECSGVTRLICEALFRFAREYPSEFNDPFDGVSIEGETLSHAISQNAFSRQPTPHDNAAAARAAEELTQANLVIQRTPGRWDIHFGRAMPRNALIANDELRSRTRLEYQSYERAITEDCRARN